MKVALFIAKSKFHLNCTGPHSAVGNVSGNRCESDCRSRGREFDPGPVPYFRGDWSWNNFYGHSPPFRWIIQEGLFSVTSESMCTKYWLTACSSLPRKSVVRSTDRPAMTIAVDLGRKATKQTNKQNHLKLKCCKPHAIQRNVTEIISWINCHRFPTSNQMSKYNYSKCTRIVVYLKHFFMPRPKQDPR